MRRCFFPLRLSNGTVSESSLTLALGKDVGSLWVLVGKDASLVSAAGEAGLAAVPFLETSLTVPVPIFVCWLIYVLMYLLVFLRQSPVEQAGFDFAKEPRMSVKFCSSCLYFPSHLFQSN